MNNKSFYQIEYILVLSLISFLIIIIPNKEKIINGVNKIQLIIQNTD